MQVDHSKTAVMHFDFAQQPDPQSPIRIGNSSLTTTTNVRLLGIRVTSELRWDQHVKDIIRKASGRLQMLRLAKQNGIPERHLLDIYYSYVRPSLEYAAPVWSTSLPQHLSNNIDSLVEAITDADIASSSIRHWNEVTSRRRRKRSTSDEDCDDHMMMGIQQLSELALALIESDVDYEMHPEITVSNTRAQSQLHVS